MISKIQHCFKRKMEGLSEAINWSSLGTVGQSHVVKLTIFVPFVGYILFFNSHINEIISLTTDVFKVDIAAKNIVSWRLTCTYFGLLILGLGTSLYVLFAPEAIKRHPLIADYIQYQESIATPVLLKSSLDRVLGAYTTSGTAETRSSFFSYYPLDYPAEVSNRLHSFINDVFEKTEHAVDDSADENNEFLQHFYTGSGYINTDAVIESLWSSPKITWAFTRPIIEEAIRSPRDVFFLEHMSLNYRAFKIRFVVAFLFLIGFSLLLVPTISTSYALIRIWI